MPIRTDWLSQGSLWLKRVPWESISIIYSITTFGITDIIFLKVRGNFSQFPREPLFFVWLIAWTQAVPFALLLAVDLWMHRKVSWRKAQRAWRGCIFGATLLSAVRQVQMSYFASQGPDFFQSQGRIVSLWSLTVGLSIVASVLFWASFRAERILSLFFTYLGPFALCITSYFLLESRATRLEADAGTHAAFEADKAEGAPVFILVFDELSFDGIAKDNRVDPAEFPNFSALAMQSAFFTNATSNYASTFDSLPTLFTGRLKPDENSPTIFHRLSTVRKLVILESSPKMENLLHAAGQGSMRCMFRGASYCLSHKPWVAGKYFASLMVDSILPRIANEAFRAVVSLPPTFHLTVEEEAAEFRRVSTADNSSGILVYWHISLPHSPFVYSRGGRLRGGLSSHFTFPGADPEEVLRRYKEQIQWADHFLGDLIAHLKREGIYESSTLIVTADHGLRTHGALPVPGYPNVIDGFTPHVPLIIRDSRFAAGATDIEYQHIDFAATLLDMVNQPTAGMDGVSILRKGRPTREKVFIARGRRYTFQPEDGSWHFVGN